MPSMQEKYPSTDPKKKKKKASTTPRQSAVTGTVQVPAGNGTSRLVRKSSAAGQRVAKAIKALELRKRGKRLLQSEKNAIKKSFNPTKVRKSKPKTKIYKKK